MQRVKFTEDVQTKTGDPKDSVSFKKGEVHELADDQAQRWVRRNKAVPVGAKARAETKVADEGDKPQADAGGAKGTAAPDYDSWTLEDLHAEAAKRDLHGRSGLDKAGLVKLIQKADHAGKAK